MSTANPLLGIQVAVTRNLLDGSREPLLPHEAIDLTTALIGYTKGSAYLNGLDKESGSIVVGKEADIVVLDKDLFQLKPGDIQTAKVTATFVSGQLVYQQEQKDAK